MAEDRAVTAAGLRAFVELVQRYPGSLTVQDSARALSLLTAAAGQLETLQRELHLSEQSRALYRNSEAGELVRTREALVAAEAQLRELKASLTEMCDIAEHKHRHNEYWHALWEAALRTARTLVGPATLRGEEGCWILPPRKSKETP